MSVASAARRLISPIEATSSSAPDATACTLADVCVEALAALVTCSSAIDSAGVMVARSASMVFWIPALRMRSCTCLVMSVANFTTLSTLPSTGSTIGL